MPGVHDDDYDGVEGTGWGSMGGKGHRLRWTKFKWILLCTNTIVRIVFCYSCVIL
jgi:hypothetical protein